MKITRAIHHIPLTAANPGKLAKLDALAWIIARPGITSPIASATSIEQTRELLGAVELKLSAEEVEALDRASAWQK